MVRRLEDAYILNLDDLPKVVQADGIVYPVLLSLREAARVFHVPSGTLRRWIEDYEVPVVPIGGRIFLEVAVLNEWITRHTMTGEEYRQFKYERRMRLAAQYERGLPDSSEESDIVEIV